MYNVPYFKANNQAEVLAFMQANPFVVICGVDKNGLPIATHIPILIEERDDSIFLLGHLMRKQQHTTAFEQHPKVLAIFNGPSSYISATLYQPQNVASTYNYQAVHASGTMHFFEGNALIHLLDKLTNFFEGNKQSAATVQNMDPAYIEQHTKAIVGFEIEVNNLEHIFKISQNKDHATQQRIQNFLQEGTMQQQELAKAMHHNL